MNTNDTLQMFLSNLWPQIPAMLAGLVAVIIVIVKWHPGVSIWALSGFLIPLGVTLAVPLVYALLPQWTAHKALAQTTNIYRGLAIFWSLLHCASYALLLVAILVRRKPAAP